MASEFLGILPEILPENRTEAGPVGPFAEVVTKEMMEEKLLGYMQREDYRPLNKSELARALELDSKDRSRLRQSLKKLEREGSILCARRGRFVLREADDQMVVGIYRRRGREGALLPTKGVAGREREKVKRVFIPAGCAHAALEGDRVLVRLRRSRGAPHWLKRLPKAKRERLEERFESEAGRLGGEVIKVLERGRRRIVGTLSSEGGWAILLPDDETLPERIEMPDGLPRGADSGYKAVATITSWESVGRWPRGEIVTVLGRGDQPGVDILAVIHKHGLPLDFPEEVLAEADAVDPGVGGESVQGREDWREAEVITIDPPDARDFDDAIAVERLGDGSWELAVHIADVSHYVAPGSALDGEARLRGNSVYLVDRVLPMLPEKLSDGVCSLRPDEERLTFCAVMRFDAKGRRTAVRFTPAVIRSRKRLTYEEAYERMKGRGPKDEVAALLQRGWALASQLRRRRHGKGSLDLDFAETKVVLDERGRPTEIRVVENDRSHQLIEEFMLVANEAVAESILRARRPSLYRIHEDPDSDKLAEFREQVLQHGYEVGDLSHRPELQRFLQKLRGEPDEPLLKLGLLKSLKRAVYHPDPLGHYGLAKEHYTHFTSPIRRYTDLVIHRVLKRLVRPGSNQRTPSYGAMGEMAEHLSTTERTAAGAELETKRLKVAEYFEILSREKPSRRFEVLVTDVVRMGLMVEIVGYNTRGLIRVHDLPGDRRYRYEPQFLWFHGGKGRVYGLGDRLEAEVARVDRAKGFIDLRVVTD